MASKIYLHLKFLYAEMPKPENEVKVKEKFP